MIALFFTAMAILQGQARPTMVAISFVIGAWVVGVPLAYVFCHVSKLVRVVARTRVPWLPADVNCVCRGCAAFGTVSWLAMS